MPRRDVVLTSVAAGLALAAVFVPWTTVGPECTNTDVSRGFGEAAGAIGWSWVYLVAYAGALGAILVRGVRGAWLVSISAVLALVSSTTILADLSTPFEAIRPRPGLAPVAVLCRLEPATGYWLATVAWVLAGIVAWRRVHPPAGWASARLAGAIGVGALNVMLSWIWVLVLVDVIVDTTSDHPSDAGLIAVGVALVAMAGVATSLAWPTVGGRAMVARGMLVVGAFALAGPLLLMALRLARFGRSGAAVLASWDGGYAILGPIFIGGIAVWGAILLGAGVLLARPRTAARRD